MGYITISNTTDQLIHVCITNDLGTFDFFSIDSIDDMTFERDSAQVCFVLRDDTGKTETFVVMPGQFYNVPSTA